MSTLTTRTIDAGGRTVTVHTAQPSAAPRGLVLYLDGDQMWMVRNRTSDLHDMADAATSAGFAFAAPVSPTSDRQWWSEDDALGQAGIVRAVTEHLAAQARTSTVHFIGYSGGTVALCAWALKAPWITQYTGGALLFGGGSSSYTSRTPRAWCGEFPLRFVIGDQDVAGATKPVTWSAKDAAARAAEEFRLVGHPVETVPVPGDHEDYRFGPELAAYLKDHTTPQPKEGTTMTTSQNGWKVRTGYDDPRLARLAGFRGSVLDVTLPIFEYLVSEFARRVEPINVGPQDDWAYTFRPISGTTVMSNHSSGTAVDLNAEKHDQFKRGTFTAAQVREIRAILSELDDVIQWGGDWTSRPDEMHFEIRKSASEQQVLDVAARLRAGTPARTSGVTVSVRAGDGWWQTARRAGVEMGALLAANGATVATPLHPGQELQLPGTSYTVRAGDTLGRIASRLGVTVGDLVRLNGLSDPDRLSIGQVLKVSSRGV